MPRLAIMTAPVAVRAFTSGDSPWDSAHPSAGRSRQSFKPFGGAAFFYCFAIN
jgi:hypothetical protein